MPGIVLRGKGTKISKISQILEFSLLEENYNPIITLLVIQTHIEIEDVKCWDMDL